MSVKKMRSEARSMIENFTISETEKYIEAFIPDGEKRERFIGIFWEEFGKWTAERCLKK